MKFIPDQNWGSDDMSYDMPDYDDAYGNRVVDERASYGMNCWALSTDKDLQGRRERGHWKRLDHVSDAGNVPLFMDSMWRGGLPDYANGDAITMPALESEHNDWPTYRVKGGIRQFAMPRHGGTAKAGTNVLFFDNAVEYVNVTEANPGRNEGLYDVGDPE